MLLQERENKDNWIEFFDSFADLCELACKEIQYNHFYPLVKFGSFNAVSSINLRISLIYNAKHLIEIYIKSIIRMISLDEKIKTHELDDIFEKLKNQLEPKLNNFELSQAQDELKEYIKQEKQEWQNGRYFAEIKDIIEYYNTLKFFKIHKNIKDIKNTLFKYPEDENKNKHNIDYYSFIYGNEFDVYKIEEDIGRLKLSHNSIKMVLL